MRIITGKLKGRRFDAPEDVQVRPTSDRAKEGLFNVIDARRYIRGAKVLDLFAGSGNLGFEAISRGAKHAVMVELSPKATAQIAKTADMFGITDQITVHTSGVERFINSRHGSFDLIFADPPYDWPEIPELVETVLSENWLEPDGWFILEHDVRHLFHEHPKCVFTKPYGRTIVSIFLTGNEDEKDEQETEES